jgi:hypothetical protein
MLIDWLFVTIYLHGLVNQVITTKENLILILNLEKYKEGV